MPLKENALKLTHVKKVLMGSVGNAGGFKACKGGLANPNLDGHFEILTGIFSFSMPHSLR